MKVYSKILIICFVVLSCSSDDDNQFKNFCSVNNPVEDLEWLKVEIEQRNQNITEDSKYCYISQSFYNDQSIFIFGDCNPLVDKVVLVYDCDGQNIGFIGDGNFPFELITDGRIVWKTTDFVCSF